MVRSGPLTFSNSVIRIAIVNFITAVDIVLMLLPKRVGSFTLMAGIDF
jgi:hypothetical protein